MSGSSENKWTLAELAGKSGLPARTIRFYISRGLLPRPEGGGRGASYGADHLERIEAIRRMQAAGRTLAEIAGALDGAGNRPPAPPPTAWWQYEVAEDVVVSVRAGASPWRLHQVRSAVADMAAQLRQTGEPEDGNE